MKELYRREVTVFRFIENWIKDEKQYINTRFIFAGRIAF
jgi:hypothetical protein